MHALEKNEFYLEGELVYRGKQIGNVHVIEFHKDSDYKIVLPQRTYVYYDGQYYIYDDRYPDLKDNAPIIDSSPEEMQATQELFERNSVLSGYEISDLKYDSTTSKEIPDYTSNNMILCDCRTYLVESANQDELDDPESVRIYFKDNELYAIQSRHDDRFIFYVSEFSSISPEVVLP